MGVCFTIEGGRMSFGELFDLLEKYYYRNITTYVFTKPDGASMSCHKEELEDYERQLKIKRFYILNDFLFADVE